MSLCARLSEYVQACFTGIWIESHEHQDAIAEIARLCRQEDWKLAVWNIDSGLSLLGQAEREQASAADPLAAVRSLSALAAPEGTAILVLENFHRYLQSAEIVQALARSVVEGKHQRMFLLILSPVVQLPVELEKLFVVIEHELPGRDQLAEIARGIGTEAGELPEGQELETLLDAASGLTRYEAEGAFSLSLVRSGKIQPESIWELKAQSLKKSGLVTLFRSTEGFDSLGGLGALKTFCRRSLIQSNRGATHKRPRGALLLGVPGTGKSAFAKVLGYETGRPTIILDLGALMGPLVGQSEENMRRGLRIVDAMAPCILFCDEMEKGLSGVASSGQTDSGVSARVFGTFLTWMSDHTSDVYVLGSCNDISKLPPEFSRAERFDGIFFLDLPYQEDRQRIWDLYIRLFELDPAQKLPSDEGWTGAEIRSCCRLAALLDLPLIQAAQNVVPVSVTAVESVDRLRTWASGRCLAADQPGIYSRQPRSEKTRRRVNRDPSIN